ncbi:Peptidoglycan/LPS O-acetylase OafA/YrhL, contains acyltransferase and SGNH-hydrolase domains [Lachnospiraceae bacterium]|nr:Peptidoglycan/LPS O-acetylase OafA/YrhL, contains acyltransferase and SGNH-hydrolase domains [Lachnospiraceae bacterium]
MNNKNQFLDTLKGIGCFFVVFMHICFPGVAGSYIVNIGGFAVPVFYMISGYYLLKDSGEKTSQALKKKIFRMAKLCAIISVLYCAWNMVISRFGDGKQSVAVFVQKHFTITNFVKFLMLQNTDIFGGRSPYWFLYALLFAYIIIWVLLKNEKWRYVYLLIPVLFIGKFYVHSIELGWDYFNNVWLSALPYILIGMFIRDKDAVKNVSSHIIYTMTLMSVGAITLCTFFIQDNYSWICQIAISVWAICLFSLAIRKPDTNIGVFSVIGSKYSLFVYILHPFVISIVNKLMEMAHINNTLFIWIVPVIVAVITLIQSFCIYKMRKLFVFS